MDLNIGSSTGSELEHAGISDQVRLLIVHVSDQIFLLSIVN